MAVDNDYGTWSNDRLVDRVRALEARLEVLQATVKEGVSTEKASIKPDASRTRKTIDPSRYTTRFIALKFAYLGQNYNGFEYHRNNATPLATIEEEVWKALTKACLILPTPRSTENDDELNWEGCEYSKCGRTDKGVSAFGQVIGIRVRSNRPVSQTPSSPRHASNGSEDLSFTAPIPTSSELDGDHADSMSEDMRDREPKNFHQIHDEMPYCQILNRLLPPDIRMLAWCPTPPPGFSARFSCRERRYEYHFTQPAFMPPLGTLFESLPGKQKSRSNSGWLDIGAMSNAARRFEGLHDFRNFCKVDGGKQITNFKRRILYADVVPLKPEEYPAACTVIPEVYNITTSPMTSAPSSPTGLYVFRLHGSAFLWHQVRHMVAILFLVGQGLESPGLVDELLDVKHNPCRPMYEMADDAPLVLRDCIFPQEGGESAEDALDWIYIGDNVRAVEKGVQPSRSRSPDNKGLEMMFEGAWKSWRQRKMDEVLAGSLLNIIVSKNTRQGQGINSADDALPTPPKSQKLFQGGDSVRAGGRYIPVMQKPRMDTVEVINEKYTLRKVGKTTRSPIGNV